MHTLTPQKERYILRVTDNYPRLTVAKIIQTKDQVEIELPRIIAISDAHGPNLPRAESVRAYLVKARTQARALLIIYINLRQHSRFGPRTQDFSHCESGSIESGTAE
jgi:hypothetical protein